jgi:Fe-S-cluster containining protein
MHEWMKRHLAFLEENGEWFARVFATYPDQMQCGRGCALCCHGLFDISFADAFLLAEGYGRLPSAQREQAAARAQVTQNLIEHEVPGLDPPFLLHGLPHSVLDRIVESARSPRCPLLGSHDECLVYECRPLACRLEGAPMVDSRDGPFGDWCELNFKQGLPSGSLDILSRDYYAIQAAEDISNEVMSDLLLGKRLLEVTVFIPSVVTEYRSFWHKLVSAVSRDCQDKHPSD